MAVDGDFGVAATSEYSLEVVFLDDGTSIAGFRRKKSAGFRSMLWTSTGLVYGLDRPVLYGREEEEERGLHHGEILYPGVMGEPERVPHHDIFVLDVFSPGRHVLHSAILQNRVSTHPGRREGGGN